jgi:hypothetical protein
MDECIEECSQLLTEKKEYVQKLSQTLLDKDSIDLKVLLEILGPRPFDSKTSGDKFIEEYLKNMEKANEMENKDLDQPDAQTSSV